MAAWAAGLSFWVKPHLHGASSPCLSLLGQLGLLGVAGCAAGMVCEVCVGSAATGTVPLTGHWGFCVKWACDESLQSSFWSCLNTCMM